MNIVNVLLDKSWLSDLNVTHSYTLNSHEFKELTEIFALAPIFPHPLKEKVVETKSITLLIAQSFVENIKR